MTKTYVIDTNVLVHDYHSFKKILNSDNKVVIPYVVLEELDKLKTKMDQVGVNARNVIKLIELELIAENPNVSVVQTDGDELADDKIIKVCEKLLSDSDHLTLVSKDVCLRTKARSKDIRAEDYKSDKVNVKELYTGKREVYASGDIIKEVYNKKEIDAEEEYYPNECIILVDSSNPKTKAITIHKNGKLKLMDNKVKPFDLECKNLEQQIAANFLLDPQIQFVTITGSAGGGKTLCTIASALESILEREEYNKLLVARPIMPFQKDIGFLPGTVEEKMIHWFGSVMDNLDFLISFAEQPYYKKQAKMTPFEYLQEKGVIDILPLTYIRGRSIANSYIVIDECSNITSAEVKTILTRAGENTKIVLLGDYSQIDNPFLSEDTNGLVFCVDKFKDQEIAAHITLEKCERSALAEVSGSIL